VRKTANIAMTLFALSLSSALPLAAQPPVPAPIALLTPPLTLPDPGPPVTLSGSTGQLLLWREDSEESARWAEWEPIQGTARDSSLSWPRGERLGTEPLSPSWPGGQGMTSTTRPATTLTVSGTVTGPDGAAPGVWVGVRSDVAWKETTTNTGGFYSVSIETAGQVWLHVVPDVATRLTQVNHYRSGVTTDITQDFTVATGHLLTLHFTGAGGAEVTGDLWHDLIPLQHMLPDDYWYALWWVEGQGYRAVLPPDAYAVHAWHLPAGYYDTTATFDLRTADRTVDVPLNTTYVHPYSYEPPDASKISVGAADDLGEATVTGAAGAALPLSHVLLVNLNSSHQGHAYSEADGSFSARLFAPPGSAIMIKHGPPSWRWASLDAGMSEGVNPFPGTIIHVPTGGAGEPGTLDFATAGALERFGDDMPATPNTVSAAWSLDGALAPVVVDGEWARVLDGVYDSAVVPGLYRGGLNWTHPALADLDSDGDLDLLIGERSGALVLYRNAGTSAAPDWKYETADYAGVQTGGWAYPALGDVTNDGAPDLFVGAGNGTVSITYNDGTSASAAWPAAPDFSLPGGSSDAAPALDDLDGDGDLDLVVGSTSGALAHFKNTGTPAAPVWTWQTNNYGGVSETNRAQPAFVDLDGDGDRDMVIGLDGSLVWYRRSGAAASPSWTRVAGDPIGYGGGSSAVSPGVGDWDGDGDRDVIIGEHWGALRFFRNGGPPAWSEQSYEFPFELAGNSAPALADWDNDGDDDMLIGQVWGNLHKFTNIGTASAPNWRPDGILLTLPWTNHPHAFPTLADIDGDNDEDLFIGEGGWPDPGMGGNIHFYRNQGTPSAPNWTLETGNFLNLDVGGWSRPVFADIDDDGDLDLFIGDEAGTLTFVQNTGTTTAPAWAAPVQPYAGLDIGAYSAPAFFDLDLDGDLDMLIGSENGSLAYVRNTGTAASPAWDLVSTGYPGIDVGENSAPAAADVNGDDQPDLLLGSWDGGLNLYTYVGPGTPPPPDNVYAPGEMFKVDARLRLYSQAIGAGTNVNAITPYGWLEMMMLYDAQGRPIPGENYFMSSLLTPGGFPIQRMERPVIDSHVQVSAANLHYAGGHTIEGDLIFTWRVPTDLPLGAYRPLIRLDIGGVPPGSGWVGANVVYHTIYFYEAALPLLVVDEDTTASQTEPCHSERVNDAESVAANSQRKVSCPDGDSSRVSRPDASVAADPLRITAAGPVTLEIADGAGHSESLIPPQHNAPRQEARGVIASLSVHSAAGREASSEAISNGPLTRGAPRRLIWQLLMDDFVQGTRGSGAHEDQGLVGFASQIVTQGAPQTIPPVDERTGQPITYRLEPFLPMISSTDRRMPTPPLIPFELPGGSLHVTIREPDGTLTDLGSEAFAQSFNRTKTTRAGNDLNTGTVQLEDVYSLKAASDRFRVTFDQYGRHIITMTGTIEDVWGNAYEGGGTYDVWVAHALDIDPGVLPMTPLAVGDAFNPALTVHPRVPADVKIVVTLYPDSDPAQATTRTLTGRANRYGYFGSGDAPITMTAPGEYRVDVTASYTAPNGAMYMGSQTWGGVVMTPDVDADLIAHGRRGVDTLQSIPNPWFVSSRDLAIPAGVVTHSLNPYYNGDIFWSRMSDAAWGGDSLILGASVQDEIGTIAAAIQARANHMQPATYMPGSMAERFSKNEIPLFSSTRSGQPVQMRPDDVDQIAYSYRTSQRPGLRVRELVAEDGQSGGYWRLDTLYDDQLGVGVQGDLPNDFKFQYVGAVYRDLESGHSEYLGQGTGWVFIPDSDATGSRVMPPFAGTGNGGWTTEGGPLMTLKGEAIDIFILPTAVGPGAVIETGDLFRFAGHIMPTLDSEVSWTATAPSGAQHIGGGQANSIGYFYDPADDFTVDEAGLWSVDAKVWHDGQCSGGATVPPYPQGDVLGSDNGRYWFYVVPEGAAGLAITSPSPGYHSAGDTLAPIPITGAIPAGWSNVTLDATIAMPGFILKHLQAPASGGAFKVVFDPVALAQDFPNLDLIGRDEWRPGLSDTITIAILLRGQSGGQPVARAAVVTLQGQQVYTGRGSATHKVYLPVAVRGG
jgi:hypothetical protein